MFGLLNNPPLVFSSRDSYWTWGVKSVPDQSPLRGTNSHCYREESITKKFALSDKDRHAEPESRLSTISTTSR